ncbi:hypothetical protein AMAG_03452 [Allomyces macrogynus ATCC 38327]|uniref:RanBD1 domain-containing protein n=1 Tax=Allomyces macrogynus (strain ATCC 38327) TaxID=578462 RepID=A0A0L0S9I1_ALLM3|nr:hypothetical protein AMAG_03452 [Allomyces macrogynus ATCC 38327]|eukprot:KNE59112.1 hypothetical protein AMAG_03452 [Allomyces macrogynus ATCC 38327]
MAKRKNESEHERRGDPPKDDDAPAENTNNEQGQGSASVPAPLLDATPRKKLRPKARALPKEAPVLPKHKPIAPFAQINFGGQYQAAAPAPAAASSAFMAALHNATGAGTAVARPLPATGANDDGYFENLRGLNESFRKAINEALEKDVGADLQKLFDQYSKYRKDIDAKKTANTNPAMMPTFGAVTPAPPAPAPATQGGRATLAFGSAAASPAGFGAGLTMFAVPSEAPVKSPAASPFQFAAPKSPAKSPTKSPAAAAAPAPAPSAAPTPASFSFSLGGAAAPASGAAAAPSAFSLALGKQLFRLARRAAPCSAPAATATATASPFAFGAPTTGAPAATTSPFKFGAPASSAPAVTSGAGECEGDGDGEGEPQDDNPDAAEESVPEYLANADANLEDIMSMKAVLSEQADGKWKKIGVDMLRLVTYRDSGNVGLLMRIGSAGKTVINARPNALLVKIMKPKFMQVTVIDGGKRYLVQVGDAAVLQSLADKIEKYKGQ